MPDIGRNDPCPCGSGKKYKKCCEEKNESKERAVLEKQWDEAAKKLEKEKGEKEKTGGGKTAEKHESAIPDKKSQAAHPAVRKHQSFAGPKYSMPRKSGGG